ncbi:LPXTG-motif cell wall anchor domain-containing protein [Gracilibacillus orientalis]|uniref:LPXTG-motif cell wall anchor domain-containing protein n=1 Tax=Gracilibacillus orientalis TaxID=334253 RepID=A0A1I4P8V3_9BACI|nr:family 43 glycosylhydrolase [Gracilibacillus orientalis]SFM24284.1 LPXTG-motif cell wall anchor domain-containing protein [Gracilibacillus orientalis]
MYKKIFGLLLALTFISMVATTFVHADNPIIKDEFSADPAAITHDGKVYLYTGHDEAETSGNDYVLKEWSIYSSENLKDWELEGRVPRGIFDWAVNDTAWASQTIEKDGKFYWYTTVENGDSSAPGMAIGVAVSDHPVTGWEDAIGGPLVKSTDTENPGNMGSWSWDDIDPTVFIDDDGQAYLYWGNTHVYYAKLKDNMMELDGDIHRFDIQNMPGTFTEAPWLHKQDGIYYLLYAMNFPEELVYATSDSPEGPWEYGGKLMDELPFTGTSHPAVLEFKGETYMVYHNAALPTGGDYRRSVAIEKLHFTPEGKIRKVIPTASGITHDSFAIESYDKSSYIRHLNNSLRVDPLEGDTYDFKWHIVDGLADNGEGTLSFQSENNPGLYLVRDGSSLSLEKHDGTNSFEERATFKQVPGLADDSLKSYQTFHDSLYLSIASDNTLQLVAEDSIADEANATFRMMNADAKGVSVSEDEIVMLEDSTTTVSAKVLPGDALSREVEVYVENDEIIDVDSAYQAETGETNVTIKGKQEGVTTVTVSTLDRNHQAVIDVEVKQIKTTVSSLEDVIVSASSETKNVQITGTLGETAGKNVTLKVESPNGEVDYLDQVSSNDAGEFNIAFMLKSELTGDYHVLIGANDNEPYETTFTIKTQDSADTDNDQQESPTDNDGDNNDPSGSDRDSSTDHGPKNDSEKQGNQDLPNTATNLFNLILIGGILILLGLIATLVVRKRKEETR